MWTWMQPGTARGSPHVAVTMARSLSISALGTVFPHSYLYPKRLWSERAFSSNI
jgi:hypothetical protein